MESINGLDCLVADLVEAVDRAYEDFEGALSMVRTLQTTDTPLPFVRDDRKMKSHFKRIDKAWEVLYRVLEWEKDLVKAIRVFRKEMGW